MRRSADFHPDLQRVARILPRGILHPAAIPLLRTATRLTGLCTNRAVEVHRLPSGVAVRLHRPSTVLHPGAALLWIHGFDAVTPGAGVSRAFY
jgi:hypothetical protein